MDSDDVDQNYRKTYNLTWSGFSSSLTKTAQSFRTDEDLTDITISAGGRIFPAHKLILSAASPLLKELLKNTKCQHPILMLAGISCSDFENILDFIYRGEINVDSEKLPSLLQAAQVLDIQALSPDALLVNLSTEPTPTFAGAHQITLTNNNGSVNTEKIIPIKNIKEVKEDGRSSIKLQKPKRTLQMNTVKRARTNGYSKFMTLTSDEDAENSSMSNLLLAHKVSGQLRTTETENLEDEKKIISDLPVNCKLCGVTIRQSRNLRRHIDQMHSKRKRQLKESKDYDFNEVITSSKTIPLQEVVDPDSDANAVTFLNFSDDSFTQLTEEILNCSPSSDLISKETSISPSLLSVDINNSSMEYSIPTHNSIAVVSTRDSSSSVSTIASPSVSASLERELTFPVSIKQTGKGFAAEVHLKCVSDNPCISDASYVCDDSDNICNVNDMAFKELENQLFSACFCSAVNE